MLLTVCMAHSGHPPNTAPDRISWRSSLYHCLNFLITQHLNLPSWSFSRILVNLRKRNFSGFPIPSKTPQITVPLKLSIQALLSWRELLEGKGMLPTAEFVIQTTPVLLFLFNVSRLRVFMNLSALKQLLRGPEMNFQVRPTHCSLHYLYS